MNHKPKYLPTKSGQRQRTYAPVTRLPNINPSFGNSNLNYIKFGKRGDRVVLGRVRRTVEVRNANNETLRMCEEHEFANGGPNSRMAIVRRGNYHGGKPSRSHR